MISADFPRVESLNVTTPVLELYEIFNLRIFIDPVTVKLAGFEAEIPMVVFPFIFTVFETSKVIIGSDEDVVE